MDVETDEHAGNSKSRNEFGTEETKSDARIVQPVGQSHDISATEVSIVHFGSFPMQL